MSDTNNLPKTIFDFLDEILGSIIPGIYFCSYILFCGIFWLNPKTFTTLAIDGYLLIIPLLAISYVIGTAFRRSDLGRIDLTSARYIYFKALPKDDNSFAFAKTLTDQEYLDIINEIYDKSKGYSKLMKLCLIDNKLCKIYLERRKLLFINKKFSKPYALRFIYKRTLMLYRLIALIAKKKNGVISTGLYNFYCFHNKVRKYIMISAVYPYSHLKEYLEDRGFKELSDKYVLWTYTQDNENTNRSKSLICKYKVEIYNKAPGKMMYMQKCEAHIRFMTALWYADKVLMPACFVVSLVSFLILSIETFFRLYTDSNNFLQNIGPYLVKKINRISIFKSFDLEDFNSAITVFSGYINQLVKTHNLIDIFILSVIFFTIARYINHIINKTFHYQRVREIVYIFQTHNECIK